MLTWNTDFLLASTYSQGETGEVTNATRKLTTNTNVCDYNLHTLTGQKTLVSKLMAFNNKCTYFLKVASNSTTPSAPAFKVSAAGF